MSKLNQYLTAIVVVSVLLVQLSCTMWADRTERILGACERELLLVNSNPVSIPHPDFVVNTLPSDQAIVASEDYTGCICARIWVDAVPNITLTQTDVVANLALTIEDTQLQLVTLSDPDPGQQLIVSNSEWPSGTVGIIPTAFSACWQHEPTVPDSYLAKLDYINPGGQIETYHFQFEVSP